MASETDGLIRNDLDTNSLSWSKNDRRENKKLRNAGLEYISRTGRTVAAKKQPDMLCNCPQKCGDKIPAQVRTRLFTAFYKMADHIQQNNFLQKYIEMRSVQKRLWSEEQRVGGRLQRRVSCKYHIPVEIKEEKIDTTCENEKAPPPDIKPNQNGGENEEQNTNEKNSNSPKTNNEKESKHENTVEVCQKAFMNMYAITEKRVRLQREKLITKSRRDAGMQIDEDVTEIQTALSLAQNLFAEGGPLLMDQQLLASIAKSNGNIPDIPAQILLSIDNDIALVNNFFCNQLWKPEYIGHGKSSSKKIQNRISTACD